MRRIPTIRTFTAIVAASLLGSASVHAAPPSADERMNLEDQADRLAERARTTKGGPQQEMLMRRARLQTLIERLEAGERVDPAEVDELLHIPPS